MYGDINDNSWDAHHEYPVKIDYFNRIRVFATQIVPDMLGETAVPTKERIKLVIKTYDKFVEVGKGNNQARDTLKEYNGAYIKHLHELINQYIREDDKNDR